jgi:site-specific recombinase XerD
MTVVQRWLDNLTPNTRLTYRSALASFVAFVDGGEISVETTLRDAYPAQVLSWLNAAQVGGAKPATLNVYRASLASFYRHARKIDGWSVDPLTGIRAHKLSPYGRSRYPSTSQVAQLLAAIPSSTIAGQRDLALVAGLYVTTRRVSEWVGLRWHNVHQEADGSYWFGYVAKGGREQRQAIPAFLWQQIEAYLVAAERWPLSKNAPIFIRVGKRARHSIPLSAGYVRCAIAKYGAEAGLPADVCHPHGLRHAGARARKESGQTPWDMQGILAHKNLATTMIYTRTILDVPKDALGDSIAKGVWPA